MADFKTIVCSESFEKYKGFLDIVKQKYKNVHIVSDLLALHKELLSDGNNITVIFIDNAFLSQINRRLSSIFQNNIHLFIVLFEEYTGVFQREPYIYDILECRNLCNINNFLIRLESDINSRMELQSLKYEMKKFYDIGKELSSEKDIRTLLELIIDASLEITSADAGTIYVVVDSNNNEWSVYEKYSTNKLLKFAIAKNKSIKLDLESTTTQISKGSIIGYSVITGQPTRIDDAYNIPENVEYHFNDKVDKMTGYRTKSILTIPMKDHQNRVLGVIQLINKRDSDKVIPFSSEDEHIIYSLAGEAAVALENSILYKNMEELLEKYRLITSEEINKRKQADEEINKLLSAIEHSPSTVMIMDATGHIQYVNSKFTQLTSYSFKEVAGKTPGFLKSGYYSADFYKEFWNTILSGKEWYGEFYNRKKNGEFYWESTSVSSLKDENNSIKYFIAVREDITEKKLITRSLEEKNIELQNALENLHKAQRQLIQKEKMASIGQLAAGVAHEVNNPLGFVMSDFETLQEYVNKLKELLFKYEDFVSSYMSLSEDDLKEKIGGVHDYKVQNKLDWVIEDLSELLKDSKDGLDRVKNIVNALRMFAGIDQFNDFSEYDLNAGVKTTLQIMKNKIKDCADISEEYGPLPVIMAAGGEINQVILNLILNAEYAVRVNKDVRAGIIHLKTYHDDNDMYFEISDNGIGIEEEQINRVFEPFYTTKPVREGIGLGLSLSYDTIVKKHKGDISVTSESGVGTRFTVKLPIMQNRSK